MKKLYLLIFCLFIASVLKGKSGRLANYELENRFMYKLPTDFSSPLFKKPNVYQHTILGSNRPHSYKKIYHVDNRASHHPHFQHHPLVSHLLNIKKIYSSAEKFPPEVYDKYEKEIHYQESEIYGNLFKTAIKDPQKRINFLISTIYNNKKLRVSNLFKSLCGLEIRRNKVLFKKQSSFKKLSTVDLINFQDNVLFLSLTKDRFSQELELQQINTYQKELLKLLDQEPNALATLKTNYSKLTHLLKPQVLIEEEKKSRTIKLKQPKKLSFDEILVHAHHFNTLREESALCNEWENSIKKLALAQLPHRFSTTLFYKDKIEQDYDTYVKEYSLKVEANRMLSAATLIHNPIYEADANKLLEIANLLESPTNVAQLDSSSDSPPITHVTSSAQLEEKDNAIISPIKNTDKNLIVLNEISPLPEVEKKEKIAVLIARYDTLEKQRKEITKQATPLNELRKNWDQFEQEIKEKKKAFYTLYKKFENLHDAAETHKQKAAYALEDAQAELKQKIEKSLTTAQSHDEENQ